jgi:adenosylhomocysteine nucleosidase
MCRILVVVGMEDERAIAAGDGIEVVVGSANAKVLRERLAKVDTTKIGAIYSFGVAGGLDPALQPGELLLSTRVVAQGVDAQRESIGDDWTADPNLIAALQANAQQMALAKLREAVFLGSDFEARENPHANSAILRDISGAAIIDNESHIAAEFAHRLRTPFVAVRAVSDSVGRTLPPAALIALDADGSPNGAAIAKSLLRQPQQIPALIRTAWEYKKALRALARFRRDIGFVQLGNCQ